MVTKENLTKEILAWGGRVLENKTSSDQGIRCRDQGKSHQGNSRVGGRVLENKTSLAREYNVVAKENRTKQFLALGNIV